MNKNVEKLLNETLKNAKIAGMKITMEILIEKYNNILESHGEEKAIEALKNTLQHIKIKAKEQDKIFWQSVKMEVFNKNKSCPCAIRDLKEMIKSNSINITGFVNETEIKERLAI